MLCWLDLEHMIWRSYVRFLPSWFYSNPEEHAFIELRSHAQTAQYRPIYGGSAYLFCFENLRGKRL